jgi:hypothetical protein
LYGGRGAAGGDEGFADQVDEPEGGERGLWCRFDDDRAARGEGGGDLVGGEQERVVEAGDADDDADRLADPEADQAFAAREQVERDGFAVQAGDFLGGGLEGEQGAVELDLAVDAGFAGFEDEQVDEVLAVFGDGGERSLER